MVHPAPMGISFVGASKLTAYVFIWLPVAAKNIIGKDFLMLLPDELHQVHQRTMSGSAPDATSRNPEIVARRADGTRFPLSLTVKPVRLNDKPVFLGMCRDITALKRAEASRCVNRFS